MELPVAMSDTPLAFEALPALKVTCFCPAEPGAEQPATPPLEVYTQARLYVLQRALQLELTVFEREPMPASRVAFVLGGPADGFLLLELSPQVLGLHYCTKHANLWALPEENTALVPARFAGEDEQGWYWGARLHLEQATLAGIGCRLVPAARFAGGILRYRSTAGGFGASYPVPAGANPLDPACFNRFLVAGRKRA